MKKLFLTCLMIIGLSFMTSAQEASNAIGLRVGGGSAFGTEVSYQKTLSNANNRLEFDLGWNIKSKAFTHLGLAGIYHWIMNINDNLNWYVGPGAIVGMYTYDKDLKIDKEFVIDIGGQIGIEYNFDDAPFQISLDTRPMFGLMGNKDHARGFNLGIALGLRYKF